MFENTLSNHEQTVVYFLQVLSVLIPVFMILYKYMKGNPPNTTDSLEKGDDVSNFKELCSTLSCTTVKLRDILRKKKPYGVKRKRRPKDSEYSLSALESLVSILEDTCLEVSKVSKEEEYYTSFVKILYLYETEIMSLLRILSNTYVCDKFLTDIEVIELFIIKFKTLNYDLNKVRTLSTELKYKELTSFLDVKTK